MGKDCGESAGLWHREQGASVATGTRLPPNNFAAFVIIGLWIVGAAAMAWWLWQGFVR